MLLNMTKRRYRDDIAFSLGAEHCVSTRHALERDA